jgi:hypothetical protein
VWESSFRRRGWHPIEETHLELKRLIQEGTLEMPEFRDWHALLVDCARKTRLLQTSYAKFTETVRNLSWKQPFEEMQKLYRPPATESEISQGERKLFDEAGLLIPWPVKEFYRVCSRGLLHPSVFWF